MKLVFGTLCVALFLVSCQKTITSEKDVTSAVVASDANSPLKSHSLTFTSDYPVKPGEVPSFSFTKTQYSDARIKTIRMLSRKNPIHPAFKKEAVELIGTFTYAANPRDPKAPHLAFLKGTSEVWEYYKTSTGAGARRSIEKRNVNLKFYLSPKGYCMEVVDLDLSTLTREFPSEFAILGLVYNAEREEILNIIIRRQKNEDCNCYYPDYFYPILDNFGNVVSFSFPYDVPDSYFKITYDYSVPKGARNYNYIPSQNLISQEYSLLEVMQWLPQGTHQRKAAGGTFKVNDQWVTQEQVYKNYKFDTNGNQTSLTYGDNVLQKTTWHVQP